MADTREVKIESAPRKKRGRLAQKIHRMGMSEFISRIIFFIFFVFMAILFLYPLLYCFVCTFQTNEQIYDETHTGIFHFTGDPQFDTWSHVFEWFNIGGTGFFEMLWNSIWFTFLKTLLNLVGAGMLAYAVARFRFPGQKLLYGVAIFVQTIPIFGSGSTAYKLFDSLNMVNNPSLFWIAWIGNFDMTFIILHGMFKGINGAYSEAAKIDGANNLTVLFRVILPMSAPTFLALFISNSISVWNDYATIQIYLRDYATLSYGLYLFPAQAQYVTNSQSVYYAAMILAMIPVAIIYALSQKLILTNVTVGGIKG